MASWTSLDELIRKITRRRVVELFDDDGDGDIVGADAVGIAEAVAAADADVSSVILRKGFGQAQLVILSTDASLRRYATSILAQYAGERRTEFLNAEGKGPYDAIGERARGQLVKMSKGEIRSEKEDLAGDNPIVGGDINLGAPVFVVSRDPRFPGRSGPGGF
jgi:hypothetical protein